MEPLRCPVFVELARKYIETRDHEIIWQSIFLFDHLIRPRQHVRGNRKANLPRLFGSLRNRKETTSRSATTTSITCHISLPRWNGIKGLNKTAIIPNANAQAGFFWVDA